MTDNTVTTSSSKMTRRFKIARWAWLVAMATAVTLMLMTVADVWREGSSVGGRPEYFRAEGQYRLSWHQASSLRDIGLSPDWHAALVTVRFVLVIATSVAISTLLWRRARTWAPMFLAWFLLSIVILTAFSDDVSEESVPDWMGLGVLLLFVGGLISMVGLLLVFPDDRSAGWVVVLLAAAAALPLYAGLTNNETIGDFMWVYGMFVALAMMFIGLVIQVTRVVKSRDRTGRDLLTLTVLMFAVFVTLSIGSDGWSGIDGSRRGLWSLAWRLGFETAYMLVPLAYGLAVLVILVRRGHWDMDVQLKGSLGYAGLTTVLVLLYFGTVAVVQAVVNDVSGAEGNTFALMVSTAAIAAAILPARSRLQRLVDRVFDRQSQDADRLVENFGQRLVRDSRPQEAASELLATVDDALRPEHADLWLVPEVRS
ncbi:MAG: hypothetical protein ACR2PK_19010 [Acidimicrobiales bacterium]